MVNPTFSVPSIELAVTIAIHFAGVYIKLDITYMYV